ncbi:MAG: DUF11 domain-containing protein [Anaerolineae bacterium]|nr:DUF11 domain-containing protein [Anaerolineae bacterium]
MRNKNCLAILVFIFWGAFSATAPAANAFAAPNVPLSLTITFEPPTPAQGDQLTFTFEIQNISEAAVQQVQLDVILPEGALFQAAAAGDETWTISAPTEGQRGMVSYAVAELAAQAIARLTLVVTVAQENGQSIMLGEYTLTAQGFEPPIVGEPIAIPVAAATNTPAPTSTPALTATAVPLATATQLPTPTPQPTATDRPSPTPSPSPSPTVTVVMAELPPTPTPKLSNEQEELGALTVSIFVFLTLAIALAAGVWIFRKSRERG